jgi:hypothetical protein
VSTWRIGDATVTIGESYVVTRYDDGTEVHAHPDGTDEQTHIARALGYGDDVAAMNRHHDLLHTLIAHARGWPVSKTLHGVAHGSYAPREISDDEERIVMLVARLLNVGIAGVLEDYEAA